MKEQREQNLFGVFPETFFHVFYGGNRELMQRSLSALFAATSYGTSYTLSFDDACQAIEDALESASYEIDAEGEDLKDPHDTAIFVLRRLKACGWVSDEIGENYQRLLHFQDYAAALLQSLKKINTEETEEYSGFVYSIYLQLRSVDPVHGFLVLERAASDTQELFRQLASLNTNIKKYIQSVIEGKDKEDLRALLQMLLEDYQTKIVDRAYYNLTTKDNPDKFREFILRKLAEIKDDRALLNSMAVQRADRKGETYEESAAQIEDQIDYIESCFESISGLMEEIDRKNHRYIASALARITFLLEAHEDLEGKINHVLKALIGGRLEPFQLFQLYKTAYLDEESLYTLKKKRLRVKQSLAEDQVFDEEAMESFLALLALEQKYSKKSVEEHFLDLLETKELLKASELDLSDYESFTFMVLGYLYGKDDGSRITVEDEETEVNVSGYRFRNFTIRRRPNG